MRILIFGIQYKVRTNTVRWIFLVWNRVLTVQYILLSCMVYGVPMYHLYITVG